MKRIARAAGRLRSDEAGLILPLTLLVLVVLATLSVALLSIGSSEVQIAANYSRATQAHFLAEAGLEDAFNAFRTTPSLMSSAPAALTPVPGLSGPGATLAPFGSYSVQYQRAGGNAVRVLAQGTAGSATRVVTATVGTAFGSTDALLTKQDLTISGGLVVSGACGNVHSNANLVVESGTQVQGNLTASGTYTDSAGNAVVGGERGGGRPAKPIPAIHPPDFLVAAKAILPANEIFQMKSDGLVLDGRDTVIASVGVGQEYRSWTYLGGTPAAWELHSNTGYDGTYYFEGDVTVSGSPGRSDTPWRASIIATGNVDIPSSPEIHSHLTDTLFVAGLDLRVNGNPQRGFQGLFAAHEQIDFKGNAQFTGIIIAEDAASTSAMVSTNSVGGNVTINYDCQLNPPLPGPPTILARGP